MTDQAIETVTLHTGHVHAKPLVTLLTVLLRRMLDEGEAIAFYEAVMLARNPDHQLFGNAVEKLTAFGILQDGRMHDATREIIVASVEGEGLGMRLRSPLAS